MDGYSPQFPASDPDNRRTTRLLVLLILVFILVGLLTIRPNAVRAAVSRMESLMSHANHTSAAAAAPTSTRN